MAREGLQGDDRAWNFDFRHPGTSAKVLSRDRDECWFERHVDHLFLCSSLHFSSSWRSVEAKGSSATGQVYHRELKESLSSSFKVLSYAFPLLPPV